MATEELFEQFPALASLAFYGTVCVLKMMLMSVLTSRSRLSKEVFANEEDKSLGSSKSKITLTDPDVERIRRIHLNDMENIPPFLVVGLFYALTQPSLGSALMHFRVFTASRLLHTVCYHFAIPQPSRALCFGVGFAITASMAIQVLQSMPY